MDILMLSYLASWSHGLESLWIVTMVGTVLVLGVGALALLAFAKNISYLMQLVLRCTTETVARVSVVGLFLLVFVTPGMLASSAWVITTMFFLFAAAEVTRLVFSLLFLASPYFRQSGLRRI